MRTFVPVEPFTRVEFASAHGLVAVESDGLQVDEEDGALIDALEEHPQIVEDGHQSDEPDDEPDEDEQPDEQPEPDEPTEKE